MPASALDQSATWEFPQRLVGRRVHVFEQVDSTNNLALTLGHDPASDGIALLREQTGGRGQYGRSWQAPPGSSVLLSLIVFPSPPVRRPALLTAWAAVSVCEAIRRSTDLQAGIKWPNDVLVAGKKVCGILIEMRSGPQGDGAAVVGIGLNVRQPAELFAQAQLPDAGSLFSASGRLHDSDDVARDLLAQLDQHYRLLHAGDFSMLEALWVSRLGLLGKQVIVELANSRPVGRLISIAFDGVKLELDSGDVLDLAPETIRHLDVQPVPDNRFRRGPGS